MILAGDTAGFVDVPSLKGIHYAMQSGMYAARTAFAALKAGDTSARGAGGLRPDGRESYIVPDLHRTRNMRLAFKDGFYVGGVEGRAHDPDGRPLSRAARSRCEEDAGGTARPGLGARRRSRPTGR